MEEWDAQLYAQKEYVSASAKKDQICADCRDTEQRFLDALEAGMLARTLEEGNSALSAVLRTIQNLPQCQKRRQKKGSGRKKAQLTEAEKRQRTWCHRRQFERPFETAKTDSLGNRL